jgi:ribonuclease VapC
MSPLGGRVRMTDGPDYVLDTFALMAYSRAEPGGEEVAALVERAEVGQLALHMSAVNAAEVYYSTWRRAGRQVARRVVDDLPVLGISVHDATLALSLKAGALKAQFPISLADCYAAALAQELGATLVTGDPEFRHLEDVVRIDWLV